jgi:phage shock protein PspC (stress-responsive transcriptional regulator)
MMQDALPAYDQDQETRPNLFFRHDTILGVCEGIGEEFGFNPNFLRVPLAAGVLWNPFAVVGIYLALGAAFALARWIYPKPSTVAAAAPHLVADHQPVHADNADADSECLAA